MSGSPNEECARRVEHLLDLLHPTRNESYRHAAARLAKARELFHEEIAHQVTKPLNEYLLSRPTASRLQKQELARWLNSELRTLGIAIRCPKTGEPAYLRGDPGHQEDRSRFQICLITNPALGRTLTVADLPPLTFIGNPLRGPRSANKGRGR